jgi:predicted ABC-type ATPase
MPAVYVIAGANGSGKSTFSQSLANRDIPILDPDAIARTIDPEFPEQAAIAAGKETLDRIKKYINQSIDFGFETTLSGRSYLKLIKSLKQELWTVNITYIGIDNPQTNIGRVRQRVDRGGHNVPIDDILRRYERSLHNLTPAILMSDLGTIYDNSNRSMLQLAAIENGIVKPLIEEYPRWFQQVLGRMS